jgi:hypothetical protein
VPPQRLAKIVKAADVFLLQSLRMISTASKLGAGLGGRQETATAGGRDRSRTAERAGDLVAQRFAPLLEAAWLSRVRYSRSW